MTQTTHSRKASVLLAGSIEMAGCTHYDDFELALNESLVAWARPLGRIVVADTLCPETHDAASRYARERHCKLVVMRAPWEDFGPSAASVRDQAIVCATTHALFFAAHYKPDVSQLRFRVKSEPLPFIDKSVDA